MEFIKTEISGVYILRPRVFNDSRGYFFESFSEREFLENVGEIHFVQDNESYSTRNVVRGLHFQAPPHAQAKLVRCTEGRVLDVGVDIRKNSPTYGKYIAVELSEENHLQLFLPRGFAHGFAVLSERARFQYKCDNYYAPQSEGGIYLFDREIDIDWKMNSENSILSAKDKLYPLFKDFVSPF